MAKRKVEEFKFMYLPHMRKVVIIELDKDIGKCVFGIYLGDFHCTKQEALYLQEAMQSVAKAIFGCHDVKDPDSNA